MDANDLRRMLLKQRRLFGGQNKLARELGIAEIILSRFMCRSNPVPRADSVVLQALGITVEQKVLFVRELKIKDELG